MKRRNFVRGVSAGLALSGSGITLLNSCTRLNPGILRIIHTNDVHSSFLFPGNSEDVPTAAIWQRFKASVEDLKAGADDYLLLDAGDFSGGGYSHRLFSGRTECLALNELEYDAITLGESDLSRGIEPWGACKSDARFDLICSNYDLRLTALGEWALPFKVYLRNKVRIGVYGLGPYLEGMVPQMYRSEISVSPPIDSALYWEKELKNTHRCDLIVCLSHLGFRYPDPEIPSDMNLSGNLRYTDLILGGHTHDALPEPIVITNRNGKRVIITQSKPYGRGIGVVDFRYEWVSDLKRKPVIWEMKSV